MRTAIFSDIHGNITALEAVLADIEGSKAVDEYWILGDIVALGPAPIEVLERLTTLPYARFIRGNTDRYVYTGDRPLLTKPWLASEKYRYWQKSQAHLPGRKEPLAWRASSPGSRNCHLKFGLICRMAHEFWPFMWRRVRKMGWVFEQI